MVRTGIDFGKYQFKINTKKELKKDLKDIIQNEKDPRIKKIIKKINSSEDDYEMIELCSQLSILDPENYFVDTIKAHAYSNVQQNEKAEKLFKDSIRRCGTAHYFPSYHYALFLSDNKKRRWLNL